MAGVEDYWLKEMTDALLDSLDQKSKVIAYLYLKMSVLNKASLEETFEHYVCIETSVPAEYVRRNGRLLVDTCAEYTLYLVPRELPQTCGLSYREQAYNSLELVRKAFGLPEDKDYGIQV